jgi:Tfp pilus tip-associated adhesin PilY1
MRAILHLCRVIYGCTIVTYGSRQRGRKSRAPQPCPRAAAAVRSSARCGSADGAGPHCLSASSLSLSAAGPPFEATSPDRRHQGRFHCEALARVGTTSALVREHHWSIAKRNCQPGVAGGPEAEKRAWLSALPRTATLFSWNIDSIVCSSGNWSKSTNCWCPRYVGRLDP